MKKILCIGLFIITISNVLAQKSKITCDSIKNIIIDERIFPKISNGQRVAEFHLCRNNIYEIFIEDQYSYYVCKPLMKKIKRAIKKNKCEGVLVQRLRSRPDVKIIRD